MAYDIQAFAKRNKALEAEVRAKDIKIDDLKAELRRLNAYVERSADECPCRNPVIASAPYYSYRCLHCGIETQEKDHAGMHHQF